MKKLLLMLPAFFILIALQIFAQEKSDVEFILPEMKIMQNENKKSVVYDFENDRNIFILNDSLIIADPDKYKYSVKISDVTKLSVRDGTYAWKTAGIVGGVVGGLGLLLGAAIYAVLKSETSNNNAFVFIPVLTLGGAIAGGLLGAIIGIGVPYFESYPLTSKDIKKKNQAIKKIFKWYHLKN